MTTRPPPHASPARPARGGSAWTVKHEHWRHLSEAPSVVVVIVIVVVVVAVAVAAGLRLQRGDRREQHRGHLSHVSVELALGDPLRKDFQRLARELDRFALAAAAVVFR